MIRCSTGYVVEQMTRFAELFNDAMFRIYTGPPPATSDRAPTGTYLGYITRDGLLPGAGHGLSFDVAPNGYVQKPPTENWQLIGKASGIAGYGRLSAYNDAPEDSPSAYRIDFEVNPDDGNGILIASPNIINGLVRDQPGFYFTILR